MAKIVSFATRSHEIVRFCKRICGNVCRTGTRKYLFRRKMVTNAIGEVEGPRHDTRVVASDAHDLNDLILNALDIVFKSLLQSREDHDVRKIHALLWHTASKCAVIIATLISITL